MKKIIKSFRKESAEEFRHRLEKMPEKKLLEFIEPFIAGEEFTALTYLIQNLNLPDSDKKFHYILEKLSFKKDLPEYLNSYRVTNNVMKETPLYLLAMFYQKSEMMQSLYDYGINPNVSMTSDQGFLLDGDFISQIMSTPKDQTLVKKHNELKSMYLEATLNASLYAKPSERKMKI